MVAAMKAVYQGVSVIDMSEDMREEQRLERESRSKRGADMASIRMSEMACESRKIESTSKFMNKCSEDMVMQVRTKQAKVRSLRAT